MANLVAQTRVSVPRSSTTGSEPVTNPGFVEISGSAQHDDLACARPAAGSLRRHRHARAGNESHRRHGRACVLVIPHRRPRMDGAFYQARFPRIRTVADTATAATDFRIDGSLRELTETFHIHAQRIPGTNRDDVALELPIHGGLALCVCELLGNVHVAGTIARVLQPLLGPPQPGCGIARVVRYREVVDRERVRAWLRELAGRIDLLMLLVGHGEPTLDARSVRSVLSRAVDQV